MTRPKVAMLLLFVTLGLFGRAGKTPVVEFTIRDSGPHTIINFVTPLVVSEADKEALSNALHKVAAPCFVWLNVGEQLSQITISFGSRPVDYKVIKAIERSLKITLRPAAPQNLVFANARGLPPRAFILQN